jgi:hypothetical protein
VEIYVAVAVVLGTIPAVMAYRKGHSPWGYLVTGILLWPMGVYLAHRLPRNEAALARRAPSRCPFCRELIQPGAIKCRWCGSDLAPGKA